MFVYFGSCSTFWTRISTVSHYKLAYFATLEDWDLDFQNQRKIRFYWWYQTSVRFNLTQFIPCQRFHYFVFDLFDPFFNSCSLTTRYSCNVGRLRPRSSESAQSFSSSGGTKTYVRFNLTQFMPCQRLHFFDPQWPPGGGVQTNNKKKNPVARPPQQTPPTRGQELRGPSTLGWGTKVISGSRRWHQQIPAIWALVLFMPAPNT